VPRLLETTRGRPPRKRGALSFLKHVGGKRAGFDLAFDVAPSHVFKFTGVAVRVIYVGADCGAALFCAHTGLQVLDIGVELALGGLGLAGGGLKA
jgi:hypothetical protein